MSYIIRYTSLAKDNEKMFGAYSTKEKAELRLLHLQEQLGAGFYSVQRLLRVHEYNADPTITFAPNWHQYDGEVCMRCGELLKNYRFTLCNDCTGRIYGMKLKNDPQIPCHCNLCGKDGQSKFGSICNSCSKHC